MFMLDAIFIYFPILSEDFISMYMGLRFKSKKLEKSTYL